VPAAAVIPAPIAYAKIAVVEKLVVGFRSKKDGLVSCLKNNLCHLSVEILILG